MQRPNINLIAMTASAVALGIPSCAIAQSNTQISNTQICRFITECFEAESCSETNFSLAIETDKKATKLVTNSETVPVRKGGSDNIRVYVGTTKSAFHVLTKLANGDARYSTHLYDGPLMVNYLGTCEDKN